MVVLIDTNVIIDFVSKREPYYVQAEKVIEICAEDNVKGIISSQAVADTYYILRKKLSDDERREALISLCGVLSVYAVNEDILINALEKKEFKDFEDCIQSLCAEDASADYLITRNPRDFEKSAIPVVTPKDFVDIVTSNLENG